MNIRENHSLLKYNTFGIDARCRYFIEYNNIDELRQALSFTQSKQLKMMHIGGGSNLLFTKDYDGIVLHATSKNIKIVHETEDSVHVQADAGVVWDDFVAWTISHQYYGLENLSYIPGEVGASAVQNIGAYGVEACACINSVNTIEIESSAVRTFSVEECDYGYRHSIFKKEEHGKYIITSVIYELKKTFTPNLGYKALSSLVQEKGYKSEDLTAAILRELIIDVRNNKLPHPNHIGSAGSFFMNPIVSTDKFKSLAEVFPQMPFYPTPGGIKLSAGWLIDQAGWKGTTIGKAGVYPKQALVLVNYGGATGEDIVNLAKRIQEDVKLKFDIDIYPEVIYV